MDNALKFLMFYGVFILLVVWISTEAGISIYSNTEGFDSLIENRSVWSLLDPFYIIPVMGQLMSIDSTYSLLYIFTIVPFIMGLIWIIATFIRGIQAS